MMLLITPLIQSSTIVAESLINWTMQSTLLILAGLLVGRILSGRGPALQSVVYRTTFAAVLLCPLASGMLASAGISGWSVHLPVMASRISPSIAFAPTSATTTSSPPIEQSPSAINDTITNHRDQSNTDGRVASPLATSVANEIRPLSVIANPTEANSAVDSVSTNFVSSFSNANLVVIVGCLIWSVVVLIRSVRIAVAWRRLALLRQSSMLADSETQQLCHELALSMETRTPQVMFNPFVSSPILAGFHPPMVLLPDPSQDLHLREVLTHELAHLRRRDCEWKLLMELAATVGFFQPLLWVLNRRIEISAEEVCDDIVVRFGGNRAAYANQLTDIAERSLPSTMALAVGILSIRSTLARRVSRIMDPSRPLSTRVGHLLVLFILAIGGIATLSAGLIGLSSKPILAQADNPAADQPKAADNLAEEYVFDGTVVDPSGKPVADAKIFACFWFHERLPGRPSQWEPIATTDVKGHFHFSEEQFIKSGWNFRQEGGNDNLDAQLCAVKDGYGLGWDAAFKFEVTGKARQKVRETIAKLDTGVREYLERIHGPIEKQLGKAGEPLRMKVDDQPIEGQIVDINGSPVPGARLSLLELTTGADGDLVKWNAATKAERADYYSTREALPQELRGPQVRSALPPVVTDKQGKFVFRGLGRDRIAQLMVEGPGIQTDKVLVRTEPGERIELRAEWSAPQLENLIYYPRQMVHVGGPSQPIVGTVVDKKSGQPIAGAVVLSQKRHGFAINGWGQDFVRTTTDENGKYRLEGMPIGDDNRIGVIPPQGAAYLSDSKHAATTADSKPLTIDFQMLPGVWVSGRIFDNQTGKGLSGTIEVFSFKENPASKRGNVDERDLLRADSEGRFRVVAATGRGIIACMVDNHEKYPRGAGADKIAGGRPMGRNSVMFEGGPHYLNSSNCHSLVEINPPDDAKEINVDLTLDGGQSIKIRVIDPDGKPVTTAFFSSKLREFDGSWDRADADGTFEILGYDPTIPRRVTIYDRNRSLAATVILSKPNLDPLVVKLQPSGSAKGRIIDNDGVPISNLQLTKWEPPLSSPVEDQSGPLFQSMPLPPTDLDSERSNAFTDSKGNFEFSRLVAGSEYRVRAFTHYDPNNPAKFKGGPLDVVIKVNAGQMLDLGDVKLASEEEFTAKAIESMKEKSSKPGADRPGAQKPKP